MLIQWGIDGEPRFPKYDALTSPIPYLSDLGGHWQPPFIVGCALTGVFYVWTQTLVARRIYTLYLMPVEQQNRARTWLSPKTSLILLLLSSTILAVIGSVFLLLLSIFTTYHNSFIHLCSTFIFLVSVWVSAILLAVTYHRGIRLLGSIPMVIERKAERWFILQHAFYCRDLITLRRFKVVFAILAFVLAIIMTPLMGSCRSNAQNDCASTHSAAAVAEWLLCFLFAAYLIMLCVFDLPSLHHLTLQHQVIPVASPRIHPSKESIKAEATLAEMQ